MRIAYVDIINFRGIKEGRVYLNGNAVFIGDNNAGKSTILEAIDLVLGPDRLNRIPAIDEHDFHNGNYLPVDDLVPKIEIEVLIYDLDDSQKNRFRNNLEFWNDSTKILLGPGEIEDVDNSTVVEALRVKFVGLYNQQEDDFEGETIFCSPQREDNSVARFSKTDKRECGFLYLRAIRTGARALSMERGSLLDIILHIYEIKPKMWESLLDKLRNTDVAADAAMGISGVLGDVQNALKEFVPSDWGSEPQLRVSDLTREHLRKVLTVFMSTGGSGYLAPFQHQGTGTVNTLVLALLSMIAEAKKNVIFAMEEPEIAIPPYTQKRIIDSIQKKSTQALFTSHSPFILEEFNPERIILVQRNSGVLNCKAVSFPSNIRPKNYNSEFRLRFSEALLAKRVLVTEGATEAITYSAASRRLNELMPAKYNSLEAMGIAVFDCQSENSISLYGEYFKGLGKTTFAVFDKQDAENLGKIVDTVDFPYESRYKGFENLILNETDDAVVIEFYKEILADDSWPTHLSKFLAPDEDNIDDVKAALKRYFKWSKGSRSASELIGMCKRAKQVPISIRTVLKAIKNELEPQAVEENE